MPNSIRTETFHAQALYDLSYYVKMIVLHLGGASAISGLSSEQARIDAYEFGTFYAWERFREPYLDAADFEDPEHW